MLLTDLNRPEPGEGFRVIRAMREHQPRCVNFILTGYPGETSATEALVHEVARYFTKPVDIEELVSAIRAKLRGS